MKILTAIKHIAIVLTLTLLGISLKAQPDTLNNKIDIEEVAVIANKKASTYSELLRVVRVISADELGDVDAISIPEILERMAMVDIRQRGNNGVQSDINFRGGTFDQTLVLLNGININDPQNRTSQP